MSKLKNPTVLRIISVVILLALSVAFTVSYYNPIQVNKTMTVFSKDGLSSDVKLNLILHRSFFKPTVVRGRIELNGAKYVDWSVDSLSNLNIWEKFSRKIEGSNNPAVFANADNFGKNQNTLIGDLIWISGITFDKHYSVKSVLFVQTAHNDTFWYSENRLLLFT